MSQARLPLAYLFPRLRRTFVTPLSRVAAIAIPFGLVSLLLLAALTPRAATAPPKPKSAKAAPKPRRSGGPLGALVASTKAQRAQPRRAGQRGEVDAFPLVLMGLAVVFFALTKVKRGRKLSASGQSDTFGSSRWARPDQFLDPGYGLVVGTNPRGELLRADSEAHVLTCASTGAGKGVSLVIPNLLAYAGGSVMVTDLKGENFAVTARYRARYLGQTIVAFDPFDALGRLGINDLEDYLGVGSDQPGQERLRGTPEGHAWDAVLKPQRACYNPMDWLDPATDTCVDDAALLASILVPQALHANSEPFWTEQAEALLTAFILWVATIYPKGDPCRTLIEVRRLLSLGGTELIHQLRAMARVRAQPARSLQMDDQEREEEAQFVGTKQDQRRAKSGPDYILRHLVNTTKRGLPARGQAELLLHIRSLVAGTGPVATVLERLQWSADRIRAQDEKTRSGIFATADQHTRFLDSPAMVESLSKTSFDLWQLGLIPSTVYLVLPPDRLASHGRWMALLIGSALRGLLRRPKETVGRVLFLLDEFAALRRLPVIEECIAYARAYSISLWMLVQDLSQLKGLYPNSWETLIGNTRILQAFGTADEFTAEYLSKMAGTTTVFTENQSLNEGSNNPHAGGLFSDKHVGSSNQSHGESLGQASRRLLTPDEVRRIAPDEQLLLVAGELPYRTQRIRYFEHPVLKRRASKNPYHDAA